MNIGLVIFGVYLLIMVGIGIFAAKLQKSTAAYWVADRGFGVPVLAIAILVSIMHGGTIIGGTGAIAARGATTLNNLSFALGFMVVLFFMARKLRRFGGFTLPDFLGDRFESHNFRVFSAFVVLVSAVVSLVAQTKAMSVVVMQLSGLSLTTSLILATAIFVFYTSIGGMMAAVWTDIAQWLFMVVGLGALAYVLWGVVGGLSGMADKLNVAAPGWTSIMGTGWSPMGLFTWHLVWFIAYFTRIEFVTKVYSARDEATAEKSVAWGLLLILVFFSITVFFGGAARLLVWDGLKSPDQAFPTLIAKYLSPFWQAMALAGVASAAMSTVSSLLLLSGAAIAHDFLRKSYFEPRGIQKSEEYYLRVSKITLLAVGVLAAVGAYYTPTLILTIVSYAVALTGATFAMPILLGLVWRRTSPKGAYVASVAGFVLSGVWAIFTEMGFAWAKNIHPIFPGLVASIVLIVVVTLHTPPASEKTLEIFFPTKPRQLEN